MSARLSMMEIARGLLAFLITLTNTNREVAPFVAWPRALRLNSTAGENHDWAVNDSAFEKRRSFVDAQPEVAMNSH